MEMNETVEKQELNFEDRHLDDEPVSDMLEFLSIDVDLRSSPSSREEALFSVSFMIALIFKWLNYFFYLKILLTLLV